MPLAPPAAPNHPTDAAVVRRDNATFVWPAVPHADAYQIIVSRHADCHRPYRAQLDAILFNGPELLNPWLGLFSPGVTYYWRVRARRAEGLWGSWSKTWRFTWAGPGVVTRLTIAPSSTCGSAVLQWQPSARTNAEPPTHYEVYGSNESGFTPRRTSEPVRGLGKEVPPNLFKLVAAPPGSGTTTTVSTTMPALANAFWRVVAVDRYGTRGGASAMTGLPRPCVYACPPLVATAGRRYTYGPLAPLLAIGDYQYRGSAAPRGGPSNQFFEIEAANVTLLTAPAWLSLSRQGSTSQLVGTPPASAAEATVEVSMLLTMTYPDDVDTTNFPKHFEPSSPLSGLYEKTCWHNYSVCVSAPASVSELPALHERHRPLG